MNAEGGTFYKPLTAATVSGNEKLIRRVIDAGADINGHRGGWYDSPLNIAARNGLKRVINLFLDLGMDVNEPSGTDGNKKCRPLLHSIKTPKLIT